MFKFKIGDEVQITAGREKGKHGKVQKVFPRENKLVVENINIYKRHRKVTRTQPAGIYEITRPITVANIALVCPKCSKLTRIGLSFEGKIKHRICKKCKGVIS